MKKIVLLTLGLILVVNVISCKKSELKNSYVENNAVTESRREIAKQDKIDIDCSKMNYNMLSSLIFDIQINPEKYADKRLKVSGNYHCSFYEDQEKYYYSVLIWDPTGCCPAGFDFIPPADMNFPDDSPDPAEQITMTGILKYYEDDGKDYFVFQAEEIIRENN